MGINEVMQELMEIKKNPELLADVDTKMEKVLKDIIKIERRYLYGLDSTSQQKRRTAIYEFLIHELKENGR